MPPDHRLVLDPSPYKSGTDNLLKHRLRGDWLLSFESDRWNIKSSSLRYSEASRHTPRHFTTEGCNGTGLRLASVLVSPKRFRTHERWTFTCMSSRSMSRQVSATSSDLRRPVLPASITIARSRRSSSDTSEANSAGVSTSGSRRRLAETLTFVMGFRSIHSCRMA